MIFTAKLELGEKEGCEVLRLLFGIFTEAVWLRVLNPIPLHLYIATSASPFPASSALLMLTHSLVENSKLTEQDEVTLLEKMLQTVQPP